MYWNAVNNFLYRFMAKYEHAPSHIKMSREFYENLEREMIGAQWLFLVKCNKIRGLDIIQDDSQIMFSIVGKEGDELMVDSFNRTKYY